jgi:P-type Ca2+ transporter type 2C
VNSIEAEPTPLERRLDALGRRLAWLTLAIAGFVALIDFAHGVPLRVVLQTGIALAVAAIPEALPAVATIALAVGMQRMARRQALVRRLPSVETLGATTVVCTDKTRTLTSGDMSVVRIWTAGGEYIMPGPDGQVTVDPSRIDVIETGALASQVQPGVIGGDQQAIGNPVDLAVLHMLGRIEKDRTDLLAGRPPRALLPFSSARKLMASFHDVNGTLLAFAKGAPSRIIARSSSLLTPQGPRPLTNQDREYLSAVNEQYARTSLRVLAAASGPVTGTSEDSLRGLRFEGFLCLADPVAAGVPATIALLRGAGLRTVMITGDQRATAEAIGREIGLVEESADMMEGRQLDLIAPNDLGEWIGPVTVFGRVSPEHKLVIVSALQQRGEIVAMLGDGVSDAAALKKADVGVAMGIRGTDFAKQAAAMRRSYESPRHHDPTRADLPRADRPRDGKPPNEGDRGRNACRPRRSRPNRRSRDRPGPGVSDRPVEWQSSESVGRSGHDPSCSHVQRGRRPARCVGKDGVGPSTSAARPQQRW